MHGRAKMWRLIGRSLSVLAADALSCNALQHWAGLFSFSCSFRRSLHSIGQEVYSRIAAMAQFPQKREFVPAAVLDEVILGGLTASCAYSNLRAKIRSKISMTDASEAGGAASESWSFSERVLARRCEEAESWRLEQLEGDLTAEELCPTFCGGCHLKLKSENVTACPKGCGRTLCSLGCYLSHADHCKGKALIIPTVAEPFGGQDSPLLWQSCRSGLGVVAPLPAGTKEEWKIAEKSWNEEHVFAEVHWPPNWGKLEAKPRRMERRCTQKANEFIKRLTRTVSRLQRRLETGGLCLIIGHWRNDDWARAGAQKLLCRKDVFLEVLCTGCGSVGMAETTQVLHNSSRLHGVLESRNCRCALEKPATAMKKLSDQNARLIALILSQEAGDRETKLVPQMPDLRNRWLLAALLSATKGLAKGGAGQVLAEVTHMIESLERGEEDGHLRRLVQFADANGSDVRLDTQVLLEGSRQVAPYPAFIWEWRPCQSYAWDQTQHINILEFNAFLNYYRSISTSLSAHSKRMVHILDSRVCSCVLAKGRSSSKMLNRSLRRFAALSLAMDSYVVPLWTISGWNFCDAGSRGFPSDVGTGVILRSVGLQEKYT